jgi:hypothetical protein
LQGGGEVVLVEDVTRLREMEAQVAREERLSAVGRYAAGLAHEIRNPLASLSGSVQLLRDEHKDPLFDIVLREVRRLNNLVEDFLDSARPVRLALTEADPGQIIGEVVATFRNDRSYETRVLRTRVRMLPSVRLDAGRFRQVIWNLLLNAAQATPDFGTIEVSAEIDEEKGLLMVRVQDDGVGIAPDALRTLFDPFYTTRAGGTGLGLANVDRVTIESVNPVSQTMAGKTQLLDWLGERGLITGVFEVNWRVHGKKGGPMRSLAAVQLADRVIVMEGGRIVETGTHQELLDRNGNYANLYRMHRRDIADLEELDNDASR